MNTNLERDIPYYKLPLLGFGALVNKTNIEGSRNLLL